MSAVPTARAEPPAHGDLVDGLALGIYEKALVSSSLRTADDWRALLAQVPTAGFSFLDLSIDESPEREARLEWDAAACRRVRDAADAVGTDIGGICLSIHRRIGPGSADPAVRRRAREVMARGLQVCHDLGVPVIQIAGYYCYYEDPGPENVDGTDVTSIRKAMEFVDAVGSPYLQVYPDLGNIAEQQLDPAVELTAGEGHMVAMHAKDVRPGEPRRVEMGAGTVDWSRSFELLRAQHWAGRLMIEMWNDDAPDSVARCIDAREFIEDRAASAGIPVLAP